MVLFWVIFLRIIWVGLVVFSGFMTLLMFAFADSPGSGEATQKMIGPIFVFTLADFCFSAWLMAHATWWSIPIAFGLTISPPFLVFLGYNLLMK